MWYLFCYYYYTPFNANDDTWMRPINQNLIKLSRKFQMKCYLRRDALASSKHRYELGKRQATLRFCPTYDYRRVEPARHVHRKIVAYAAASPPLGERQPAGSTALSFFLNLRGVGYDDFRFAFIVFNGSIHINLRPFKTFRRRSKFGSIHSPDEHGKYLIRIRPIQVQEGRRVW